jgi:hypothetical protein
LTCYEMNLIKGALRDVCTDYISSRNSLFTRSVGAYTMLLIDVTSRSGYFSAIPSAIG